MAGTATWYEGLWAIVGLTGTINCAWLLADVIRQRRALGRAGIDDADRLILVEALGVKSVLVAINAIVLLTGVAAMLQSPPTPARAPTPAGLVTIVGLFGIAILANALGWWYRWRRAMLRAYLAGATQGQAWHDETMAALALNAAAVGRAADAAERAYIEANNVNLKIAAVSERGEATLREVRRAADSHETRDEAREGRDVDRADQATEDLAHNTELTEAAKDAAEAGLAEQQRRRGDE